MPWEFFRDPLWLLLIPLLLGNALWQTLRKPQFAITFSSHQLVEPLPFTLAQRLKQLLPWLAFVGMVLIVIALARPRYGIQESVVRTEGIAIEMCIDRSGSMDAMDFEVSGQRVNRLTAVKDVIRKFIGGDTELAGRSNDIAGLVIFGGFAESKVPLTLDHQLLLDVLDSVHIPRPIFDRQGRVINRDILEEENATAIGDALTLAVDRIRDSESKSKIIILLSDGENTTGVTTPAEGAKAAAALGIKVYTIGVGSTGVAPFPQRDRLGNVQLVQGRVRLDEDTLKMIALETGGKYFNARSTAALNDVYSEIDQLEKSKTVGRVFTEYRELFSFFLLPGIAFILLTSICQSTRFRSLP